MRGDSSKPFRACTGRPIRSSATTVPASRMGIVQDQQSPALLGEPGARHCGNPGGKAGAPR